MKKLDTFPEKSADDAVDETAVDDQSNIDKPVSIQLMINYLWRSKE